MIFILGAAGFILGWLLINVCGGRYRYNNMDYLGGMFCIIGIGAMLVSLLMFIGHFLP